MANEQDNIGIGLQVETNNVDAAARQLAQLFSNVSSQILKLESDISRITKKSSESSIKASNETLNTVYKQIEALTRANKDGLGSLDEYIKKLQSANSFLEKRKQTLKDINKDIENQAKLEDMLSKQANINIRRNMSNIPLSNPQANNLELQGMLSRGSEAQVLSKEELKNQTKITEMLAQQKKLTQDIVRARESQLKFNNAQTELTGMLSRGSEAQVLSKEELKNQNEMNKAQIVHNNAKKMGNDLLGDTLAKSKIDLQNKRDLLAYDLKNGIITRDSLEYLKRRTAIIQDELNLKNRVNSSNEKEASYNSVLSFHAAKRAVGYSLLFAGIAGVTKVTSEMIDNFLKADLAMRTMGAILDLNEAQTRFLAKSVRTLGESYGGSLKDIDEVALALGRAGMASHNIVPATEIVLRMARLTGDTFQSSASAVISFQQVYGDTTSIERLGDKLAYIANVSRLSTQDIGTFANYALAASKAVGITEDAVGGLAAAFSNAGVNASTIGTQIRTFSGLLTENTTAVQDFFTGIGVGQKELATKIQAGGRVSNTALLDFIKILKKVDTTKFNELTGSMDKLTVNVLQLMRNNESNINKYVKDLETGMEGQLRATDKILESYQVKIEKMWNSIMNAGQQGMSWLEKQLTTGSMDSSISEIEKKLNKFTSIGQSKDLNESERKSLEDRLKQLKLVQEYQQNDTKMIELTSKLEKAAGTERKTLLEDQVRLEIRNSQIKEQIDEDEKKRAKEAEVVKKQALLADLEVYSSQLTTLKAGSKEYEALIKTMEAYAASLKDLDKQTSTISLVPVKGFDLKDIEDSINKTLQLGLSPSQAMMDFLDRRVTEVIDKATKSTDEFFKNSKQNLGDNLEITISLFDKIKSGQATYADFLPLYDRANSVRQQALDIEKQLETASGDTKTTLTAQWEAAKSAQVSFAQAIETLMKLFNVQIDTQEQAELSHRKDVKHQQDILDLKLRIAEEDAKISGTNGKKEKSEIYKQQLELYKANPLKNPTKEEDLKRQLEQKQLEAKIAENLRTEGDKGIKQAEKKKELQDKLVDAQTKLTELMDIANGVDKDSKSYLQDKLQIESALVQIAYERWQNAKGTEQEVKLETDYTNKLNTYMEINNKIISKSNDELTKRKALNEQLQSDLSKAIETEQLRLGIITQSNGNEYETLRIKIREAEIAANGVKLSEEELKNLKAQLEQYRVLHKQKKDLYTLSREYQKELEDMDTAGYNAAKAGLSSLESGMMDFFDVTSQGWLNWHSLATNVLNSIYKQLLNQLIIKQMVSGISGGIAGLFGNGATAATYGTTVGSQQTAMLAAQDAGLANGGYIGYASGGLLTGGSGVRDDLYLGKVNNTQVFAMGGEFITKKDSVNPNTRNTLEYINQTGQVPNGGTTQANVNVPVSVNIENQTGQNITADMVSQLTKSNDNGDYEKVVNIVLKASQVDPRVRNMLKR